MIKFEEINYRNGKKNGKYNAWYRNGNRWVEREYVDDEMKKEKIWYQNGDILRDRSFR